jgi:hypothetical protein
MVRTWFEPEPNLLNAVLSVLVRSSGYPLLAAWFWFAVQRNSSENRTEPNFGISTNEKNSEGKVNTRMAGGERGYDKSNRDMDVKG